MSDMTNTVAVCTKKKLGSVQVKASTVLAGKDGANITKILSVNAHAFCENAEVVKAEVRAMINIKIGGIAVYEDGSIGTIEGTNSVKAMLENASVKEGLAVTVMPYVLEISSNLNSGEAVTSVIVSADIFAVNKNIEVRSIAADADVFTRESDIEVNTFKTSILHTGMASCEEKPDAKFKSVLMSSHNACIKNAVCGNDYITISGEIFINTIYACEDGQIKSFIKAVNFSEEIEALGVTSGNIIQARIFTNSAATVNPVADADSKITLNFELPFTVAADIFDKSSRECIVDAYHLEKEVNLTTESFEQNQFFSTRSSEESIVASYSLSDDKPRIEKILSVTAGSVSIVNSFVKTGEVVIEGIANINTAYFSEDDEGNNVLNSMTVDLPYSLSLACSDASEGDNAEAQIILGDVSVKNRKGRELEIIAGVKVSFNIDRPTISAIATQITYGEEKPQKEFALEIYVAKENQSLWDIAKFLNISTESLLEQNAELALPVSAGDKIVCYRKREVKF